MTLEAEAHMALVRPRGVSMLTALVIIGGIVDFSAAVLSLAVASVYLSWVGIIAGGGGTGLLLTLIGFGSVVVGIFCFVLAYGLWNARSWAWTWTLISSIVGLVISVIAIAVGIGLIGIVIYPIIMYYLTRSQVKAFFGKGVSTVKS
jgi:hypothetical protein